MNYIASALNILRGLVMCEQLTRDSEIVDGSPFSVEARDSIGTDGVEEISFERKGGPPANYETC